MFHTFIHDNRTVWEFHNFIIHDNRTAFMIAVASRVDTCTYTVNELSRSHANIQHVLKRMKDIKKLPHILQTITRTLCSRVKPLKPYNLSIARSWGFDVGRLYLYTPSRGIFPLQLHSDFASLIRDFSSLRPFRFDVTAMIHIT